MSDSVDRVFAHALQTVRKIPRTRSARPPPEARLKLYGLYKQSMEGDVEGVMERPEVGGPRDEDGGGSGGGGGGGSGHSSDAGGAEVEKWDAWHAQQGISKTEAKRRYITTLIETMHKYASSTQEARDLVAELEFVWDQVRSNASSSETSPAYDSVPPLYREEDVDAMVMRGAGVLSPVSPNPYGDEEDVAPDEAAGAVVPYDKPKPRTINGSREWRSRVEKALAKMTTEVAALREQLESSRVRRRKGRLQELGLWALNVLWLLTRHLAIEAVFWGLVFLWMRKRGDQRAEEALKMVVRFVKERLKDVGLRRRR